MEDLPREFTVAPKGSLCYTEKGKQKILIEAEVIPNELENKKEKFIIRDRLQVGDVVIMVIPQAAPRTSSFRRARALWISKWKEKILR